MERKLRPLTAAALAAGPIFGLSLASSLAHAEARPVGGNKAVWDKACMKSSSCLPVGDLGNGVDGYSVVNPDGSETNVYCNATRCAGEDGPAPQRQVPKPSKAIVQALAGANQLGGAATTNQQTYAAAKPDPLDVIQGE
jgi:hypothetical protein